MKPAVIRLYKSLHSWTGIICGLLLFVAFYAGAITMFKQELARWAEPPRLLTPLERAPDLIARTLAARPEAGEELTLYLGRDHTQPRLGWHDPDTGVFRGAELAPNGALVLDPELNSYVARAIDLVHRAGGLPIGRDLSLTVMGMVALLYALAIVSGLIVVLPSLVRDVFAIRIGKNLKRMWLDLHNVIGIASLPFHLFIALTTIAFAFNATIYDVQNRIVYDGQLDLIAESGGPFDGVKPSGRAAEMLAPAALGARARSIAPGFEPESITYLRAGDAAAVALVRGRDPDYLSNGSGYVRMSAVTGEILNTATLPSQGNRWNATANGFVALHFGSFGGAPVRWAYFLLGLGGAFLFYTGNLLWIESRRRKARAAGRPVLSVRLLGAATVGIAFGCMIGISLTIAAAKGLHGQVENLRDWHAALVHLSMAAALLLAIGIGAARSVVPLMVAAASATAAIPLTSLAGALFPALGIWNSPGGPLGVDLVATAGAVALAWAARRTHLRIARASPESLWFRGNIVSTVQSDPPALSNTRPAA